MVRWNFVVSNNRADESTLDLLEYVLTSSELKNTMFIGAYRSNEMGYPLIKFVSRITTKSRVCATTIAFSEDVGYPNSLGSVGSA